MKPRRLGPFWAGFVSAFDLTGAFLARYFRAGGGQ